MSYITALDEVAFYIADTYLDNKELNEDTSIILNNILQYINDLINKEIDGMYVDWHKEGFDD